jgi:hypothetical protein
MKKNTLILIAFVLLTSGYVRAQDAKVYSTSEISFLFSWADATNNGQELSGPVRFAPFFNFQNSVNKDISEKIGLYIGTSINNIGFIYDVDDATKKKVRTYNLGIPVGLKIGDLDGTHIIAGYAIEFPLNYKEKTFINEEKTKFNTWFSDRTKIQQALTVGIQFPQGANIKFKYYFTDFYDKSYTASDGQGGTFKPYENFSGNAMVISLGVVLFKGTEFTY